MKHFWDILAKGWSILLYPLFIPTYGILFFCAAFSVYGFAVPSLYWWVSVLGTFLFTCVIPLTAILILIKRGAVSNLYIDNASERTTPYIYTIICFAFWCYFMYSALHVPMYLLISAIGATVALIGVACVNPHWKISAHLCGLGGLMGGIISFCMAMAVMPPIWLIICASLSVLLLMYARLYLNAHTPLQVVCGFLSGLLFTFIPNLIYYSYAQ